MAPRTLNVRAVPDGLANPNMFGALPLATAVATAAHAPIMLMTMVRVRLGRNMNALSSCDPRMLLTERGRAVPRRPGSAHQVGKRDEARQRRMSFSGIQLDSKKMSALQRSVGDAI